MALKLNTSVFHKGLGMAHASAIDHGEWDAPEGSERNEGNSIGHEEGDEGKATEHKYPIIKGSKVSAKGVGSALGYARKNDEHEIIAPLQKISDAIHGVSDDSRNLSRACELLGELTEKISAIPDIDVESLDLSRAARLAKCPDCGSHDVTRGEAASEDEGPMDTCAHCGKSWAHKPGTLTAAQHSGGQQGGQSPEVEAEVAEEEQPHTPLQEIAQGQLEQGGQDTTFGLPNFESPIARGVFGVM